MNHRGKFRKQFLSLLLSVTVYILSYSSSYSLDDETTRDLQEFIQSYVEDLITAANPGSKVEITAPNLEKRINMTSCDGFLFAELIKKDLNRRNNTVGQYSSNQNQIFKAGGCLCRKHRQRTAA